MPLEEYKGIQMPIPDTGKVAIIKMNAEKSLYEKYFKNFWHALRKLCCKYRKSSFRYCRR